eukprot:CAMPEP_0174895598 /NCGR_PEP_ID=MMETSP0167-20121228/9986_1 /TAXON_ID=38298 /ORGANISM="Rhodella maculata, Strain CCMP736" /LENGTH=65 /DNA_ID=CAMNT_0016134979 /DNA_START=323 /DNA_END=517 /DNA_ORIENTATION=+
MTAKLPAVSAPTAAMKAASTSATAKAGGGGAAERRTTEEGARDMSGGKARVVRGVRARRKGVRVL